MNLSTEWNNLLRESYKHKQPKYGCMVNKLDDESEILKFQFNYQKASTKLLMKLLSWLRADISYLENVIYNGKFKVPEYSKVLNGIKKVLATREHVPNKKERKEIRRILFNNKKK